MGSGATAVTPIRDTLIRAAGDDTAWLNEQLSQRDWEVQALASFRVRLNRAERDAVRLYFELRKMVGTQQDMLALAVQALGVASMAQAQSLIGLARSVEGVDRESVLDMARKLLENEGWTCLRPARAVNHGGVDAQGTEAQDR